MKSFITIQTVYILLKELEEHIMEKKSIIFGFILAIALFGFIAFASAEDWNLNNPVAVQNQNVTGRQNLTFLPENVIVIIGEGGNVTSDLANLAYYTANQTLVIKKLTSVGGIVNIGQVRIATSVSDNASNFVYLLERNATNGFFEIYGTQTITTGYQFSQTIGGVKQIPVTISNAGDLAVSLQGTGVLLKATDGANCYRLTVNNTGAVATTLAGCV